MFTMPKLSVIVPIYNVEKYLDCCIQSIINQSLKDIEIILVDDESPDNCPQICDKYVQSDHRIKVIHKKNEGLGFARNTGIEQASGKYITFVDSDDFVSPQTFEHLCNYIDHHSLDVIYYRYQRFTDISKIPQCTISDSLELYQNDDIKKMMLNIIASGPDKKLNHKIECSSCCAIYKMEIIKRNNIHFHSERQLISEDLIFNLDFLSFSHKAAINQSTFYYYRTNTQSLTLAVRSDRIEKNLILYHYINKNLIRWGLNDNAIIRNKRLFIDNARASINILLYSDYPNKSMWLNNIVTNTIWLELAKTYDWKKLPFYPQLIFYLCYKKNITGIYLVTYIRRLVKKGLGHRL